MVGDRHHHRVGGAWYGWYCWRCLIERWHDNQEPCLHGGGRGTVGEPTEEPSPEPTGYTPKKSDWVLKVKIKDKQCFGSAGCNVTAKITPYYNGGAGSFETDLPDEGVIELTYKVTGDESGPITGTLEIDCADQTNEIGEESMSTRRSGTEVKATVTDVEYNEYG